MKLLKNLNAKQRRNLIVTIAAVLLVVAAYELSRPGVLKTKAPPVNAANLLGSANPHALQLASINNSIASEEQQNGVVSSRLDQIQREMQQQKANAASGGVGGTSSGQVASVASTPTTGVSATSSAGTGADTLAPPTPSMANNNGGGESDAVSGMPGNPDAVSGAPDIETWGATVAVKPHGSYGSQPMTVGASSADTDVSADTSDSSQGNTSGLQPNGAVTQAPPKVFIPAGTMLTGVLLTGVDAPTGREASSHPIPVLVRVKEDAILPNEYRADYRECFIVASAMGDLSSERAYLRGQTLSCVAQNGGVIQAALKMWGTGEDGKAGMRGTLVSKQGSILAKAMLAGFAAGIGRVFTPQETTTIATNGDGYATLPVGVASRMAGMSGVSSAANQVASYYLQLAEDEFPVIEISAGRPVTFIVEQGAELSKLESK